MTSDSPLRFQISNFGPVKKAQFDLKPLTIFIGSNNTGKSYTAQLVYAVYRALSLASEYGGLYGPLYSHRRAVRSQSRGVTRRGRQSTNQLITPEELEKVLRTLPRLFSGLEDQCLTSYSATFGTDISDLVRDRKPRRRTHLEVITAGRQLLSISHTRSSPSVKILDDRAEFSSLLRDGSLDLQSELRSTAFPEALAGVAWQSYLRHLGHPLNDSFYLPAARSGILAAWPLLARVAISTFQRNFGRTTFEVGALTGVVGDFLNQFIELTTRGGDQGRVCSRVCTLQGSLWSERSYSGKSTHHVRTAQH